MKIALAIREAGKAETALADLLLRVGERHRVDHDVFHMSHTLATKSRESLLALADAAERYGVTIDLDAGKPSDGLRTTLREKSSELLGDRPQAALLLLRDLREVHLRAAEASIKGELSFDRVDDRLDPLPHVAEAAKRAGSPLRLGHRKYAPRIALAGNPRLVPELYPHMAEPVCQRCGEPADCDHLGREHDRLAA